MKQLRRGALVCLAIATIAIATTSDATPGATEDLSVSRTRPTAIIVLENKSASRIVGNPAAPYLNTLLSLGTRFTNYREGDPSGPSLPDYLQLVAGSSCGKTSDVIVAPDPDVSRACPRTVWNQLQHAGRTWALYQQKLPSPCYLGSSFVSKGDQYALKHDPGPMFSQLPDCRHHVLPLWAMDPTSMPDVSFITPSICNDMHGSSASWAPPTCRPGTDALIHRGDRHLESIVPRLLANRVRVFVAFDEPGLLYAVAAGPGIRPGATDDRPFTHYSWLRAIEHRFGLPYLGGAATAKRLPI
jgi:phosphatidylinositol-3-phosphatase